MKNIFYSEILRQNAQDDKLGENFDIHMPASIYLYHEIWTIYFRRTGESRRPGPKVSI
ncbi:MAG: hypothetical protein HY547_04645 [Elusimicrobia bacterium]|nr:hypothetical protein [Elusimicrobiota bacterium]